MTSSALNSLNASFSRNNTESASQRSNKVPPMVVTERVNPSMLTNPLTLQATTLRNAEYFEQTMLPSLVEEGDILFPILRDPLESPCITLSDATSSLYNLIEMNNDDVANSNDKLLCCNYYNRFGIQPVLTFPSKVGVYVVNEVFRAFLCFFNSASYPLHNINIVIEYGSAQATSRTLLLQTMIATLEAKRRWSYVAEIPLLSSGVCTLHVKAVYVDPSNETRQLVWASSIPVEEAVSKVNESLRRVYIAHDTLEKIAPQLVTQSNREETSTKVGNSSNSDNNNALESSGIVPSTSSLSSSMSESWRNTNAEVHSVERTLHLPSTVYLLRVTLSNPSSVPLVLAEVSLISSKSATASSSSSTSSTKQKEHSFEHALFTLLRSTQVASGNTEEEHYVQYAKQIEYSSEPSNSKQKTETSYLHSNALCGELQLGKDVAHFLQPNDTRTYTFPLLLNMNALRHQVRHGVVRSSSSRGSSSTAILPSSMAELGHIYWRWTREDGESGSCTSPLIRLSRLRAPAELELVIASITQNNKPYTQQWHANYNDSNNNSNHECILSTASVSNSFCNYSLNRAKYESIHDDTSSNSNNLFAETQNGFGNFFAEMPHPHVSSALYGCNRNDKNRINTLGNNGDSHTTNGMYCSLSVGTPVTLECVLLNYSETKQIDVALKIRCEKLVPYWIYAGAAVKPLGMLEPLSSLRFTVELIPWQTGWLPIDSEGLTIVNARKLDLILLPISLSRNNVLSSPVSSPVARTQKMTNAANVNVNASLLSSTNIINNINYINNVKTVESFADSPKWLVPLSSSITGGLASSSAMTQYGNSTNNVVNSNTSNSINTTAATTARSIEQIEALDEDSEDQDSVPLCTVLVM